MPKSTPFVGGSRDEWVDPGQRAKGERDLSSPRNTELLSQDITMGLCCPRRDTEP